jgi:hypothetical protein
VPLLRSQDAKIELLSQRLEQGYFDLMQSAADEIDTNLLEAGLAGKTREGAKTRDGRGSKKSGFFRRFFG